MTFKNTIDEGYIKYQCHWTKQKSVTPEEIAALNQWRNKLYQLGLIGQYDNGIGFGNLSRRCGSVNRENNFIKGIITFGKNIDEAENTLLSYYQKFG